jgi:hypothetical protein
MGFLSDWRQRRAARAYATKLGPWLAESFGAATTYTPAQIRRGIEVLNLDAQYVAFGYAAFLSRKDYDPLVSRLPVPLSYGQAHPRSRPQLSRSRRPRLRRQSLAPSGHFPFSPGRGRLPPATMRAHAHSQITRPRSDAR